MLDDGVYASVSDIGDAENISKSYVSRILRLALLAPDINEAILERRTDQSLMLRGLSGRCRRVGTSSVDDCSAHACPKNNKRLRVRDAEHACVGADTVKHGLWRPRPSESIFYFLVSALVASGFGFAGALGTAVADAGTFFLSALGFLASRLLLF